MRMIGHLQNEPAARTFSHYLYVNGIKNQIEAESDGTWGVWIHAEDELDQARNLLSQYQANPNDPSIRAAADQAQQLLTREQEENTAARKRFFGPDRVFAGPGPFGMGRLTFGLIVISVGIYIAMQTAAGDRIFETLSISNYLYDRTLIEVRQGQIWRLLTPIFIHLGPLHILFNMLWMRDLGTTMERHLGAFRLALQVVVIGILSNAAQYFASGPAFGGMSGVVYGLLGYIWMKGKFDPASGLFLHPSTVAMMLIWLVFGYTNLLPMANTVHAVGLGTGVIWGFAEARFR
jgi:GlpG protein